MSVYTQKDVQICIDNSIRLFTEAFLNLQPPTRYGLLEISVEEAVKAWWVYFVIHPEKKFPGLENVDYYARLTEKFEVHTVKAGEMQTLTKVILSVLKSRPPTPAILQSEVKGRFSQIPAYRHQQRRVDLKVDKASNNPEVIKNLSKLMESVTKVGMDKIPEIKEKAFYVDKGKDGLNGPNGPYDYNLLAWMCIFISISKEFLTGDQSGLMDLFKIVTKDGKIYKIIKEVAQSTKK